MSNVKAIREALWAANRVLPVGDNAVTAFLNVLEKEGLEVRPKGAEAPFATPPAPLYYAAPGTDTRSPVYKAIAEATKRSYSQVVHVDARAFDEALHDAGYEVRPIVKDVNPRQEAGGAVLAGFLSAPKEHEAAIDEALDIKQLPPIRVHSELYRELEAEAKAEGVIIQEVVRRRLMADRVTQEVGYVELRNNYQFGGPPKTYTEARWTVSNEQVPSLKPGAKLYVEVPK